MTTATTSVASTAVPHWRTLRWVALTLVAVVAISAIGTYFTAARPGGRMDPDATTPEGAHAIVALLAERGVDVVLAQDLAAVERSVGPDSLLLIAQTKYPIGDDALRRLTELPGDVLLVAPSSRIREALAPRVHTAPDSSFGGEPACDLRAATRAGKIQLDTSDTFEPTGGDRPVGFTSCYRGALVRYTDSGRTTTVVGSSDFLTNNGLLNEGNAALAMNLTGARRRLIWYAPQRTEADSDGTATITDLIPDRIGWIVLQLGLAVLLVAVWRGRRIGPLVAENLPVVVRASETVEGRGRLYRSRRSRDRAAAALRTAGLRRMLPRLGIGTQATPATIVETIAQRVAAETAAVEYALFGRDPSDDAELVNLARLLDDIERQVATS